jgi:hypothetical protein
MGILRIGGLVRREWYDTICRLGFVGLIDYTTRGGVPRNGLVSRLSLTLPS